MAVYLPDLTESAVLESLACWCQRLTPVVSLAPPNGLLLELQGSLKLFGGFAVVKSMLSAEVERRRLPFHASAAPTCLGALWLARHAGGDELRIERLPGRLGSLPVRVTAWPVEVIELLTGMGIAELGDCLRLPRDGFARRVGRQYLNDLDKALGRAADARVQFKPAENLTWKVELTSASEDRHVFAAAIERMLESAVRALRERQGQAQNLKLFFHHAKCPPTVQAFSLLEPVHEKHRLLEPLLARLERVRLPAPAVALGLRIGALQAMQLQPAQLFAGRGNRGPAAVSEAVLIERLRERLGDDKVYGFALLADHRPERAWTELRDRLLERPAGAGRLSAAAQRRPLWLLPKPLPLSAGAAELCYREPVQIDGEPERIESGWWDGGDVKRDYYTATAGGGEKLWVYRDLSTDDWYLHGIFG